MDPEKDRATPMRAMVGLSFVVEVVIAAGALIGGLGQLVGGLLDLDWERVASGVVGLLLGGAFAAMAYGYWSARAKVVVLSGEDGMAVAALRATEAATNEPSKLRLYMYFPDAKSAEAAAAEVGSEGFSTDVRSLVVAERDGSAVNEETLPGIVAALEAVASRHGGELDGWGVST